MITLGDGRERPPSTASLYGRAGRLAAAGEPTPGHRKGTSQQSRGQAREADQHEQQQHPTSGSVMAEALVAALVETWRAIQKRHLDVPDFVLTLGSGTIGARRARSSSGTSWPDAGTP